MTPCKTITLLGSTNLTAAASVTGDAVDLGGNYKHLAVLLSLTTMAGGGGAGDTLDVYIDVSPDGGTTWINAIHFTQITGAQAAQKQLAKLTEQGVQATAPVVVTADAASGVVRDVGFFNTIRERHVAVEGAGDINMTFNIKAHAKA